MDSIRDFVCVHLHGIKSQLIRIIHSKRNSLIYAKMLENRINYCSISIYYVLQKEVNLPYFLFYLYQCPEIIQLSFVKSFWSYCKLQIGFSFVYLKFAEPFPRYLGFFAEY